jgi:hypothetical protein
VPLQTIGAFDDATETSLGGGRKILTAMSATIRSNGTNMGVYFIANLALLFQE